MNFFCFLMGSFPAPDVIGGTAAVKRKKARVQYVIPIRITAAPRGHDR